MTNEDRLWFYAQGRLNTYNESFMFSDRSVEECRDITTYVRVKCCSGTCVYSSFVRTQAPFASLGWGGVLVRGVGGAGSWYEGWVGRGLGTRGGWGGVLVRGVGGAGSWYEGWVGRGLGTRGGWGGVLVRGVGGAGSWYEGWVGRGLGTRGGRGRVLVRGVGGALV